MFSDPPELFFFEHEPVLPVTVPGQGNEFIVFKGKGDAGVDIGFVNGADENIGFVCGDHDHALGER